MRARLINGTVHLAALLSLVGASRATAATRVVPQNSLVEQAQRITGDTFRFQVNSPRGVSVLPVNRPSEEMRRAIDQGFADLFTVAAKHGYRTHVNFADYTVFIARADRTKDSAGNYSPDIAVPAGQYAGSGYDQGGFIYAAGMVLANNPSAFVFAEHTGSLNRVSDVVRYEGEHIVLFFNDRRLYQQTADHSRGGGHPILQ
jgi:hypothetical protein